MVDVSPETLSVTTLGEAVGGTPVNLERAMKLNERIGGHLVAGHVDAVGTIRSRHQEGNAIVYSIEAPPDVLRYCVTKGSVTVDGISLTINHVTDSSFSVAVIPHTATATTLGLKRVNDTVNLESDLINKYVERLLQQRSQLPKTPPAIDKDYLKKRGLYSSLSSLAFPARIPLHLEARYNGPCAAPYSPLHHRQGFTTCLIGSQWKRRMLSFVADRKAVVLGGPHAWRHREATGCPFRWDYAYDSWTISPPSRSRIG